jgi:hypothetical protein
MFGVSSDEYLDYATANRTEWEIKGKEIVRGYLAAAVQRVDSEVECHLSNDANQPVHKHEHDQGNTHL